MQGQPGRKGGRGPMGDPGSKVGSSKFNFGKHQVVYSLGSLKEHLMQRCWIHIENIGNNIQCYLKKYIIAVENSFHCSILLAVLWILQYMHDHGESKSEELIPSSGFPCGEGCGYT